jgi:hypothetical protein
MGVYIRKYPPRGGAGISSDVIWRKKYEKGEETKEEKVKRQKKRGN